MEPFVGALVQLSDGREGVIRYYGETDFSAGIWVGVELATNSGKNDGSVQGRRYFNCEMGKGMFLKPPAVTVTGEAPPPAAKAPARKSARPSSLINTTRAPVADSALKKRMSLNAPSPSPGPKSARPSAIARVSEASQSRQEG
jgi:dynactin 1